MKFMKSTKTMLIAALAAGALLAGGLSLLAQDATNTPSVAPHQSGSRGLYTLDRVSRMLKLTDDEKTNVAPILESLNKNLTDLRADTSLSMEDRTAKRKDIMSDATAQLKPLLTDDQFARWQKLSTRTRRPAPSTDGSTTNAPATTPP